MSKFTQASQRRHLLALLRQIRVEAGLRQVDLAKRLKQSQSFVSKYESGERRLDLLEIQLICEAVGISLADFVSKFEGSVDEGERTVPTTTKKFLGKRPKH
jgi:transcriptional regulator with XRE-family HTH domain